MNKLALLSRGRAFPLKPIALSYFSTVNRRVNPSRGEPEQASPVTNLTVSRDNNTQTIADASEGKGKLLAPLWSVYGIPSLLLCHT